MDIMDLLQMIRCCNLHQVMEELKNTQERKPEAYKEICLFYVRAKKRKPKA